MSGDAVHRGLFVPEVGNSLRTVIDRVSALRPGDHEVLDPHVAEGAAGHDAVVAAAGAEGIELGLCNPVFDQVLSGWRIFLDGPRGRDVVGGDRVAEDAERPGVEDIGDVAGGGREPVEERWILNVGRGLVPLVGRAGLAGNLAPLRVGGIEVTVKIVENLGLESEGQLILHLGLARPDVSQEDRIAVRIVPQRIAGEIQIHPAGQGVGHHQRRRHQEVGPDRTVHPRFEVAIARKDRGAHQVSLLDRRLDGGVKRTRVPDAGRAAVTDGLETELIEILLQAGPLQVVGHHPGARSKGGFHVGRNRQPFLIGFPGEKAGRQHDARVGGVGATRNGGDQDRAVLKVGVDRAECLAPLDLVRSRTVGDHLGPVALAFSGGQDLRGVCRDSGRRVHHHRKAGMAFIGAASEAAFRDGRLEERVEGLIEPRDVDAVLGALGAGHRRDDLREVQFQQVGIVALPLVRDAEHSLSFEVGLHRPAKFFAASRTAEVIDRLVVDREEAHGGAVFGGHVGDGGAIGQGQCLRARTEELHELADHSVGAQHLGDAKRQVGGGDSFRQVAVQVDAHHLGNQEGDRLTEHAGLGFDAAHAPAHHAETVDHGGVGVGSHQGVGVVDVLLLEDPLGEILEIDLVNDADSRGDHREGLEGLLAPLEELVALAVADELDFHVPVEGGLGPGEIDLHRVVDHQVDRYERLDRGRLRTLGDRRVAHGRQVNDGGYPREILQDDAGHRERDLVVPGGWGVPVGKVSDILLGHLLAIDIAEDRLEHDPDRNRETGEVGKPLLRQSRKRMELAFGAGAGGKTAERVHGWWLENRVGSRCSPSAALLVGSQGRAAAVRCEAGKVGKARGMSKNERSWASPGRRRGAQSVHETDLADRGGGTRGGGVLWEDEPNPRPHPRNGDRPGRRAGRTGAGARHLHAALQPVSRVGSPGKDRSRILARDRPPHGGQRQDRPVRGVRVASLPYGCPWHRPRS